MSASRFAPNRAGRSRIRLLAAPLLLTCSLAAQTPGSGPAKKPAPATVRPAGVPYQPGNHRDPFFNPLLLKKELKVDEEVARGTPPPGIAGTLIAQATLQGIAQRKDERVAVVRASDSRAYFLREGDRLFDGYLKTIGDESITLVHETKMKSGTVLTQVVTKRLRTP